MSVVAEISDDRRCVACGYALRGLSSNRCPECGLKFDPSRRPPPVVPWLNREGGTRLIAFWKTVWFVIRHAQRFGEEVWSGSWIDPKQVAAFRTLCVWIAAASMGICLWILAAHGFGG